jgi:transposase
MLRCHVASMLGEPGDAFEPALRQKDSSFTKRFRDKGKLPKKIPLDHLRNSQPLGPPAGRSAPDRASSALRSPPGDSCAVSVVDHRSFNSATRTDTRGTGCPTCFGASLNLLESLLCKEKEAGQGEVSKQPHQKDHKQWRVQPIRRRRSERPGFDAHLLPWKVVFDAEQVRPADSGQGCPFGDRPPRRVPERVGGDQGLEAVGDERRDLRNWIRLHQVDDGQRDGVSTDAAKEILGVWKAARSFFVRESDPRSRR